MKRGEIYYIQRRDTIGAEIMKSRPGVIVSNDALNGTSGVVEVVYLTTAPKKELPTHVAIQATGTASTALCEGIDSVSTLRVGNLCGECSEEEMAAIDKALLRSLGLEAPEEDKTKLSKGEEWLIGELGRITAERDRYAKMVDHLLGAGT